MKEKYQDIRTQRVLGFLVAKGLLVASWVTPKPMAKIRVPDALWVAEHVEPRVFEVLPAALIRFPATFIQKEDLPDDLKQMTEQLVGGIPMKEEVRGIPFHRFRRWTEANLPDGRTKAFSQQKRTTKSFRLPKHIALAIAQGAKKKGISESAYVEHLVRKDGH